MPYNMFVNPQKEWANKTRFAKLLQWLYILKNDRHKPGHDKRRG
jgi:hypothetical protein